MKRFAMALCIAALPELLGASALPDERRVEKLRALADASARHNLGSLRRNFNDPNLGLLFVYRKDGFRRFETAGRIVTP